MDLGYTWLDILTGGNLSSIKVDDMDIIYWSVRLSSRREGDRVKGVEWGIVILANSEYQST